MKSSFSLTVATALTLLSKAHVRSAPIEESIHERSLLGGENPNNIANILNLSGSQGKGKNLLGNGILGNGNDPSADQLKGSERTPLKGKGGKLDLLGQVQQLLNQPKGKALLKRGLDKGLLSKDVLNQLLSKPKVSSDENETPNSRVLSTPLSGASKGANPLSNILNLGSGDKGANTGKPLSGLNLLKRDLPIDILSGLTGGKSASGKSILSAPETINRDERVREQEEITRILDDKKEKEKAIIQGATNSDAPREAGLLRIVKISREKVNSEPVISRIQTTKVKEEKQGNLGLGKIEILKLGTSGKSMI
ncbi:hypothetical protein K493DRAFT_373476 [Basidiobolus meristosporus CBS 931.73]|uniref:WH2 domain-containing protein n=1 Tax=Basidiobolus meristosporus CBS 931.73 TaxID=1314790 RepID=A0A1Y1ZDN5_9FUNG|nr:hypothetical protein K493DRAFT_373476 [Basidiobolus meristosporus CBS 931.73]|eukprot:ORY08316.1 hypothetical protein K493DRAFT_373476 [Basidiobolus meristosporus CBS 931.73]